MSFKNFTLATVCSLLVLPLYVLAQEDSESIKTDWIELVKGYKGETVGAEVMDVEEGDVAGTRKITLAIPKQAIGHPDDIEEVVVVGRKPEDPEPLMNIKLEWLDDYDNDNYGLVIHLSEDSNWPIRLYMSSEDGFIR